MVLAQKWVIEICVINSHKKTPYDGRHRKINFLRKNVVEKFFLGVLKSTRLGVLENSVFRGVRRFVFPKSVLVDVARTKAQIHCSFQKRYTFSRDVEKKAGKRYWKPLRAVLSCKPSKSTLASLFLFCCSKKSPQFTAKSPKVKS